MESNVSDMTLDNGMAANPAAASRARALGGLKLSDLIFHWMTFIAALFVLALLGAIILSLVIGAWPALAKFGPGFLVNERWSPSREIFGALAPIYGTIVTSIIAMISRMQSAPSTRASVTW